MNKYNNGIIYKLCCKDPNITDIYIGSTTNFTKRKCEHKTVCNNTNSKHYNQYKYEFIRENGGWDNWDMIEIIKVNCNDKYELQAKEREQFDIYKPKLNSIKPQISNLEWIEYYNYNKDKVKAYKEANKNKIKEYRTAYYETNKNKIKEYRTAYYETNKNKIKEYYETNKDKIKEYYETNKDKLKADMIEYRKANKDKIKAKNKAYYEANKDKEKARAKAKYEAKKAAKLAAIEASN
jgi:hypothetical protein